MQIDEILSSIVDNPGSGLFFTAPYYKNRVSYFFSNPEEIISPVNKEDLFLSLNKIDGLSPELTAFVFLSYEAGYAFEKKLESYLSLKNDPLGYFSFYTKENVKEIYIDETDIRPGAGNNFCISSFEPDTPFNEYEKKVDRIKNYIAEGDTYQVNFTIKVKFDFKGNPAALFKRLIFNQSAEYTAFLNTGEKIIISVSPELFFKVNDGKITARPMKGTAPRGINPDEDKYRHLLLRNSEKDKAENLMVADLLRNDLGRICRFGSVKLNSLFDIEKYETLFQMTSEIEGELNDDCRFSGILKNIYPCGSVTGAPKIRTMEIIHELEKETRGVYTGSIGFIKQNEMKFNVAIRTIILDRKNGSGELGIGSGIVWDSSPREEYKELQLKSHFMLKSMEPFELFETMKIEKGSIPFLTEHLNRMKYAAGYFLFLFDEEKIELLIREQLQKSDQLKKYRLKIILGKYGKVKAELIDFPELPGEIKVILSEKKTDSKDPFSYFKTTNRKIYDEEFLKYSAEGFFEVIFLNEKNQVAEGSRTNIFIRKNDQWYTPPVKAGILNGVFRSYLLKTNKYIMEKNIYAEDLIEAEEIKLTNALRGEVKVNSLYLNRFNSKEV